MPAPWNRPRVPAVDDRSAIATVVPPTTSWQVRPGDSVAHAYSTAAGWMRSVCRAERWTVALGPAPDDVERCNSCAILVDGAPGEVTEAFGG